MRDLFDEFLEELRRRQAAEQGQGESDDPSQPDRAAASATPDDEDAPLDDATGGAEPGDDRDHEPRRPFEPLRGGAGDGGRRPPRRRRPPNDRIGGRGGRGWGVGLVVVVLLLLFTFGGFGLDLWTDAIWYRSVGFDAVFWTRLGTQALLFVGFGLVALVVLLGNLWLASRLSPPVEGTGGGLRGLFDRINEVAAGGSFGQFSGRSGPNGPDDEGMFRPFGGSRGGTFGRGRPPIGPRGVVVEGPELPDLTPIAGWVLAALAVLLALVVAGSGAGQWETILLWQNRVPFSPDVAHPVTDPVFGRDVGFYLFELPFLRFGQSLVNGLLLGSIVVSLGRYLVSAMRGGLVFSTPVRVHLAVLGGLYLVSVAAGYQLDKLELVYSTQGVATGVAATDAAARFVAFDVLTVIAALSGALLVGGAFTRAIWPLGAAIGVWLVASVVLSGIYPEAVQRFTVSPNELAQEQPYIANNIRMTRLAYGLDQWQAMPYAGTGTLTQNQVAAESDTFSNARLWAIAPLQATLDQIQTIRQYYDFTDVDTDRYQIGGQTRQVMLSARELAPEKNPLAGSWVNSRITFTHGIGLAMVPVNAVTPEGQPELLIKDLPPSSVEGAPQVMQARIYFGERPSDYVLVDARQDEFDYPAGATAGEATGSEGARTRWSGTTGIRMDTTLARLLFAARFRDLNLLISDQVTSDTQLLFHRSLADRLTRIAPFLRLDKDPYLVVTSSGRLVYVQDAYTTSDRFPNAEPMDQSKLTPDSGLAGDPFDYIRNSVKIVVDAYDGTTTFYAADPNDPMLRAYEGVFPTLFRPIGDMPADLRAHLRVPEELFNVQNAMYATYHVTDPATFYGRNDLWTVPTAQGSQANTLPSEAYYVVMRMPGEPKAEFLLLQPLVPNNRPNMIAWVAARNDGANYGAVRVFQFPQDTTIFGPAQIEARINQDPIISAQFTLWNQSGSNVVPGNLIVVPVQDTLIYLQSVYLQSTGSKFPEFKKIVVASPTKVVWGDTLTDALQLLLAGGPSPGPSTSPAPAPSASPGASASPGPSVSPQASPPSGDLAALIAYANDHFERAQAALRAGDFATYGQEIKLVQNALRQLQVLAGGGAPASPSAAP